MKKSLVKQLLEFKASKREDDYEDTYLEITERIESLCYQLQKDCLDDHEAMMILVEMLRSKANDLEEHAADLK